MRGGADIRRTKPAATALNAGKRRYSLTGKVSTMQRGKCENAATALNGIVKISTNALGERGISVLHFSSFSSACAAAEKISAAISIVFFIAFPFRKIRPQSEFGRCAIIAHFREKTKLRRRQYFGDFFRRAPCRFAVFGFRHYANNFFGAGRTDDNPAAAETRFCFGNFFPRRI